MTFLKLPLAAFALLAAGAAHADDPDTSHLVGRWGLEEGRSIMTISDSIPGRVTIENTFMDSLYAIQHRSLWAAVEGDTMTIGKGPFAKVYEYDAEADRLVTADGATYRPVPDDWEWTDGFGGLSD